MATQEQINEHKGWLRRQRAANGRVDAKQYGYCDPQGEEDGLSCCSIDDEIGQRESEIGFTVDEIDTMEYEVDQEIKTRRNRRK